MKNILSIDGGGIRGVIIACLLVSLEKQFGKLTRELFDFVAGTSTGALIAAAVAAGVPATQILQIYTERSREIFNHPPVEAWPLRIARGWAYDPANIARVLRSEFGTAANWTLNDSPIKVLLTAKGIDKKPLYFVPDNPKNAGTMGKLSLIDCAVASAAATTYFDAWDVPGIGLAYDGGLGVTGNPVHQACVEAFDYDSYNRTETRVISLGTGFVPAGAVSKPKGLLAELGWLIDALLSAPEDEQTDLVDRYYPGVMQRFNWPMPQAIDMADISKVPELVHIGHKNALTMDWKSILGV